MKKFLSFFLAALLASAAVVLPYVKSLPEVNAAGSFFTVTMNVGGTRGERNGSLVIYETDMRVVPFTERGVIYIPLAYAARAFGGKLTWDAAARTASMFAFGSTARFTAAKSYAQTDADRQIYLGGPVIIRHDRMYVPMTGIARAYGINASAKNNVITFSWEVKPLAFGSAENFNAYANISAPKSYYSSEVPLTQNTPNADINFTMERFESDAVAAPAGEAPSAEAASAEASDDFSHTNVQVAGVDEGDVIKTDGEFIYYLNNAGVAVVRAYPPESMELLYTIKFDGTDFFPTEIYIDGGIAVVTGNSYASFGKSVRTLSRAQVYDVSDKNDIKHIRTVEAEGFLFASRRIGGTLYLISNQSVWNLWTDGGIETPLFRDLRYFFTEEDIYENIGFDRIYYFPPYNSKNFLTVTSFDIHDPNEPADVRTFYGAGENVYVSNENIYVSASGYDGDTVKTTVFKFALNADALGAGGVGFIATCEVPGTVLNQFSMDEHGGYFRIATTGFDPHTYIMTNNLYVFDSDMNVTGKIENIAPDERIYSVRFMGGRGYMVTFRLVDPLFAFDLSDPYDPKLLGALKIPGYSSYLHPYDEFHLIGFGKDTEEHYGMAFDQGMKLSMFDVTDLTNPIELFTESIGGRGTSSELLYNHRALLFSKEKDLLAFPAVVYEKPAASADESPFASGRFTFAGALVYGIDMEKGFVKRGEVTHLDSEDMLKAGLYGGDYSKYIKRLLYIGDTLYSASESMIKSHRLSDLAETGSVELEMRAFYSPMPLIETR
ncbi:MAG: beta-propeller domain-containing protein [Defluviitaleaceae bacterium]|nr:beta-propeller domain-containing protein [Defluviitaleaceae bacterium]